MDGNVPDNCTLFVIDVCQYSAANRCPGFRADTDFDGCFVGGCKAFAADRKSTDAQCETAERNYLADPACPNIR
jgi:hypothetical protein